MKRDGDLNSGGKTFALHAKNQKLGSRCIKRGGKKTHFFLKLLEFVNTQRGLENEFVAPNETPSASVISTEVMLTSCCARRSAAGRADEPDPR